MFLDFLAQQVFPLTNYVWLAVITFLLIYEVAVIAKKVPNATLSESVWAAVKKYPYIAFFAGLLCGHFFWR